MKWLATLLSAAAAVATVFAVPESENTRGLILAHKAVDAKQTDSMIVQGRNFTVKYTVVNVGPVPVVDVQLSDDWPESSFNVLSGSSHARWEEIAVGQTVETSVTLAAKVAGTFSAARAQVLYSYPLDDATDGTLVDKTMQSSSFGEVRILTETQYKQEVGDFFFEKLSFLALAMVPTVLPAVLYVHFKRSADALHESVRGRKKQ